MKDIDYMIQCIEKEDDGKLIDKIHLVSFSLVDSGIEIVSFLGSTKILKYSSELTIM